MNTLIIAEKPAVAKDIATKLYDQFDKKDTYYDVGDNVYITWCYGHLLALKEPKDHNREYAKWSMEHLPYKEILEPSYIIHDKNKKQLNGIIKLLKSTNIVIHAGDPDDEGQRLVDEILEYANYKGEVKRLLLNDNNIEIMKKSFANMKDNKDFYYLSQKALARSIADMIFGMNLTVACSKKHNEAIYIGRVFTPILSLIVNRYHTNKLHHSLKYYELESEFCFDEKKIKAKLMLNIDEAPLKDGKLFDKSYLEPIKEVVNTNLAKILSFKEVEKKIAAPLPFNLLKLQIEASKKYNLSADKTLAITQDLREKYSLISYNRSDCQYLNDEQHLDASNVINAIHENINISDVHSLIDSNKKSKAFDSSKVSAHYGIIPTIKTVDFNQLTENEKIIYKLIAHRYIAQFLPDQIILESSLIIQSDKYAFKKTFTREIDQGWKIQDHSNDQESAQFDKEDLKINTDAVGQCIESNILEKETKPPSLYTEATLLTDLTQVSKYIDDPALKKVLLDRDKGKEGEKGGIGTPATRSAILKSLFDRKYIQYSKKNIIPTPLGENIFRILPGQIKRIDLTAKWQIFLNDIEEGKLTVNDFINQIQEDVISQIEAIKNDDSILDNNQEACKCGGVLRLKKGKYGEFWSCSNYPECKHKYTTENGQPVLKLEEDASNLPKCKCGGVLRLKKGKYGEFWSCSNYPECKHKYTTKNGQPVLKNQ